MIIIIAWVIISGGSRGSLVNQTPIPQRWVGIAMIIYYIMVYETRSRGVRGVQVYPPLGCI